MIRAVQGEAGDKDRAELPVLAGSLTQPDHVAQKGGHERCPPYMSRRVDKVNLSLLIFFMTERDSQNIHTRKNDDYGMARR